MLTVATAGEGEGLTRPILSHPVSTWVSLISRGALLDKSDTDNGIQEMAEVDEVEVAHLPLSGSVAIIWNSVQLIFPSSSSSALANISLISQSDTFSGRFLIIKVKSSLDRYCS